ncbi:MAG: MobF family relaxase [Egibacteraceae bacterium]
MAASLGKLIVGKNDGRYYLERVATERHDYYAGHGEATGIWAGQGAHNLCLTGEVKPEQFLDLLACRHPDTGDKLKARQNTVVLGFDLTFSAPKSVSALYALGDDRIQTAVLRAHEHACAEGLAHLEDVACVARLGTDGVDRQPGLGFIAACFRHRTSRAGDPQLHTHTVMANIVQTGDGRAAAYDGGLTYRHCRSAGAVYDGELRKALTQQLGIRWEKRGGQWEIVGIPADLCAVWSKRRREIQDLLDEWEQSSSRAAQYAMLATRTKKDHTDSDPGLHDRWLEEALEHGFNRERILITLDLHNRAPVEDGLSDDEVVEQLLGPEGLTEKSSGFGRRDILVAAERLLGHQGVSREGLNAIADRTLADDRVLDLLAPAQRNSGELLTIRDPQGRPVRKVCTEAERRYTTAELVEAELEALHLAEQGRGRGLAVVPDDVVDQAIAANPGLDPDQEAMVRHLCASGNFIDLVEGRAGTGKSHAVGIHRQALEHADVQLIGVAPSATAAHVLGQQAGVRVVDTVHGLLARLQHTAYRLPGNAVIVLDEAAMCDTAPSSASSTPPTPLTSNSSLWATTGKSPQSTAAGCSPPSNSALASLSWDITTGSPTPRQRGAAEHVRDRDADNAINQLDALGLVHIFDRVADAHAALVDDWFDLVQLGESARMFADTNKVVADLNIQARHKLIRAGAVAKHGHTYTNPDTGHRIRLAAGDRVRLGRNDARLQQPDGVT